MYQYKRSNPPLSFSRSASETFGFSPLLIKAVSFCFDLLIIDKKIQRACSCPCCFHSNHSRYAEISKPTALFFCRKLGVKDTV